VLEARDFTNWPRKSRHPIDGAIKAMNRTELRVKLRVACSMGIERQFGLEKMRDRELAKESNKCS